MAFTEPQFRFETSSLEDYTLDTVDPDGGVINTLFNEAFNEISISTNQAHTGSKSMYMLSIGGFANCFAELTQVDKIDVSEQESFKVDVWWYHVVGDAPSAYVSWFAGGEFQDSIELGRLTAVDSEWAYSEWVVPVENYSQMSVLIAFDQLFPATAGEGYVDDWQVWFEGSEPEPQPLGDIVYRGFRFPRQDFTAPGAMAENGRYMQTQIEKYLHSHEKGEEHDVVPLSNA